MTLSLNRTTRKILFSGFFIILLSHPGFSQTMLPTGFSSTTIGSGWTAPVGTAFDNSGNKLFVWEKGGKVYLCNWNTTTQLYTKQATPVLNISDEVGNWRDFGMLGFALDPNFNVNGFIYVLYVVDRHHLLYFGTTNYNTATDTYFDATIGRVTRYKTVTTVNGIEADVNTRTILIGESISTGIPILHQSHGVGSLHFAADGSLLISAGDGANYNSLDKGSEVNTYYVQALADGIIRPKENVGAYRSQLIDCLNGKLLRINPVTGDGIPSNPFYDPALPRSAKSRVWAMGFRNPFRFSVRPNTGSTNMLTGDIGEVYLGDVGHNTFEELNIIKEGGANFGWPIFEGYKYHPTYSVSANWTANQDEPNPLFGINGCTLQYFNFQQLIKQATADNIHTVFNPCNSAVAIVSGNDNRFFHSTPAIDWKHGTDSARINYFVGNDLKIAQLGSPESGATGTPYRGNCAIGGCWYTGSSFPVSYKDSYFMGDLGGKFLKNATMKNASQVQSVTNFASGFGNIVCITENPLDGSLIIVDMGAAASGPIAAVPVAVKRISYGGNQPPVIILNQALNYGTSPLTIAFQSSYSYDPEGFPITYSWNFGDGSPVSTEANPTHIFTAPTSAPAPFTVTLTITDQQGATDKESMIVSVNNTPPTVDITSPVKNSFYKIGPDTLYSLAATVTDAEHTDPQLTYEWQTKLIHNNHSHTEPAVYGKTSSALISRIGCNGDDYHWQVRLTVTDGAGLSTTDYSDIYPQCTSAPLPLVLKSFMVKSDENRNNLLRWITEAENNVGYFELERSSNGNTFKTLEKMAAKNGPLQNEYSFLDENPYKGFNYYRLKMADKDGSFRYSFTVKINAGMKPEEALSVSPNPVANKMIISTRYSSRQNVIIRILNLKGQQVYSRNEVTVTGDNSFVIDQLNGLNPGVYIVEIQDENSSRRTKMIKAN